MSDKIAIEIPKGFEVDVDTSTSAVIQLRRVVIEEPPLIWSGWFVDDRSNVIKHSGSASPIDRNIFVYEKQANACIALSQLSQLMKQVNGGWDPDWKDSTSKYCIFVYDEGVFCETAVHRRHFLAFKTEVVRDTFMEKHLWLIEQAIPLL